MKTFNEYIEAMLLYKESIGYSRKSYEYDLMRFCNYPMFMNIVIYFNFMLIREIQAL